MTTTLVIDNIDPEMLDAQRRALVRLIWDDPDSVLWGLVNMLDVWSDKQFPDRIYICTRCKSVECDGDGGRFIVPVNESNYPLASETKPCEETA